MSKFNMDQGASGGAISDLSIDEIENVGGASAGAVIVVLVVLAAAYYLGRESDC